MTQSETVKSVFIFDLDDTLYKEADYRASGIREVCSWVKRLYGKSVALDLQLLAGEVDRDFLTAICRLAGLPFNVKETLLWIYRLHAPDIHLHKSTIEVLRHLESIANVAILTDGRSVTQRLKLKALGLDHLPAYISEEHDSPKPSTLRFQKIMQDIPSPAYVYVADNPAKDFVAPNSLGWETIGLRDDGRNIHSQQLDDLQSEYMPSRWIDDIAELTQMV